MEYQESFGDKVATITVIRPTLPLPNGTGYMEADFWVCYYSFEPAGGFLGESVKNAEGRTATFSSTDEARAFATAAIKNKLASKR